MARWAAAFEHLGRVLGLMGAAPGSAAHLKQPMAVPHANSGKLEGLANGHHEEGRQQQQQQHEQAQKAQQNGNGIHHVTALGHVSLLQRQVLEQCLARVDALLFYHLLTPPGVCILTHKCIAE